MDTQNKTRMHTTQKRDRFDLFILELSRPYHRLASGLSDQPTICLLCTFAWRADNLAFRSGKEAPPGHHRAIIYDAGCGDVTLATRGSLGLLACLARTWYL